MHIIPALHDWTVVATCDNCIKINIENDLDIEGSFLRVLGPTRLLITEIKPVQRDMEFCHYTGEPMFVELHTPKGVSVHYVKGSGADFYNQN